MKWIIYCLLFATTTLYSKPIIDIYRWREVHAPSMAYGTRFERPNFTIMVDGKNSHVALVTNFVIHEVDKVRSLGYEKIIGYVFEGRSMSPEVYAFVESNLDKFDLILTFDEDLLKKYPEKCKFYHALGYCTLFKQGIHEKSKLCSCMASSSNHLPGHLLRRTIVDRFEPFFDACKHYNSPWSYWKDPWINDFCFSVVVENSQHSHYFTEKIIECFQAGTIPIYWGCPSIGDFFDMDGIITFKSLDELETILQNLSFDEYQRRLPAVRRNFELAAKYPTYTLTTIIHHKVGDNPLGHVIEEFTDRPDTFDLIWPFVKDFFPQENDTPSK